MQHEQQHQELLITDIKYILGHNPLHPAYDPLGIGPQDVTAEHDGTCPPLDDWLSVEGQTIRMGHQGPGFAFDNESPSHLALIQGVDIRVALVTNDEYLQFMRDGGYQRHSLWHAEGWDWVQTLKFRAPMYWQPDPNQPDGWGHYTLQG
jgi:formylglycine-generating enzyme required for sulfatase activity